MLVLTTASVRCVLVKMIGMAERERFIWNRVAEHYQEVVDLGFEVVGVWLQGSQNYGLDEYSEDYLSDVDTKAIILPSFDDIVRGKKPYSHTHVRANNEHIDIKDIREMFEMFKKQNNAYLEILFTSFVKVNPKYSHLVAELHKLADDIVRMHPQQAVRCLSGMSLEKIRALEHPYPATMPKIEKYGYDPKQLHHILRINDLISKYVLGKPYKECLAPDNPEQLMAVKKGCHNLQEARYWADYYDKRTNQIKDTFISLHPDIGYNQETYNKLMDLKVKFIKQFLKEELGRA